MHDFHGTFSDLLHAANLRHGPDGFTSPPKEGVLRIFTPLKIRRLWPALNPRTWVRKVITLPLDHRRRFTHLLTLPPGNIPGTRFCYRLSRPQDRSAAGRIVSMKNTPWGIEPANFRFVAPCLNLHREINHYYLWVPYWT
jgi:hypothetical protein